MIVTSKIIFSDASDDRYLWLWFLEMLLLAAILWCRLEKFSRETRPIVRLPTEKRSGSLVFR